MVQPTEVFSFPVLMWSNHRTGQFCGSTEAAVSQAEPDPNHTSCPCNDCTNHHKFLWGEITLTVPLQQIRTDFSPFVTKTFTGLPPYPPISACLLSKTKGKPVWGLKTSLDVKEKLANLDLNIYFGGLRSCWLVLSLHIRSHICTAASCGICSGVFSLRGRKGADGVCLCLGTKYRSQTTP